MKLTQQDKTRLWELMQELLEIGEKIDHIL